MKSVHLHHLKEYKPVKIFQGFKDEAEQWIAATVRYYPQTLPYMVETAGKSTHFNELTQDLLAACYVYRQGHPEIDPCVPQDAQSSSH